LSDEKAYAYELFIQEEVSKTCARALVKYDAVTEQMKTLETQSVVAREPSEAV
jgi:hypothetical protein